MNTDDLESTAERALARVIPALQEFVGVASISARGELLEEGAALCAQLLRQAGLTVETWRGRGAPVVYAWREPPPGAPTILFYGHYDVQPPEPLDAWQSPPFEGVLREGAIYGRGAGDNKGQLLAHIAAVQTLIETGRLGVGVKFLVEGEEEIGSPHLAQVASEHRQQLTADLALTSDAPVHDDDQAVIIFGVRGLLYLQLDVRGAARDLHSGNRGGLAPTPAWDLVHALSSLRDEAGHVLVPGFYDPVREPTSEEAAMLRQLPFDRDRMLEELGLDRLPGRSEHHPWEFLMFRPTFNISGLRSGYGGPGAKTIVPCQASCKLDIRLVADQRPDSVLAALREHLARHDPRVQVTEIAAVPPSATAPDTPLAAPVIEAVTRATGTRPWLRPRLGGTTPDYVFTEVLGMPSLLVPYGPPDMNHHAPNEKMTLRALRRGIACSLEICAQLAG